ncbi:hypothetical protein N9D07_02320 [Alphaproteobacteria bacterium]|jgi:hypothetical protein|nr:hypothetical protein [Alphaproteobacteria bacterium]MBT4848998.1 hypothetical protein [Alphaproteobacteria bacterium]MDA8882065.1 hypothetical protein [Alphaproteobacteria bacterium]MDA9765477.1 hypothetical protein [Alphaproteobacteria bacterium]MDB0028157.1 hypothetical protein [Alphaproteobacteria bacterium]|tara:strand:+ start:159 stop:443 length:285 start_codon:yes stop_codon:yes gene_type:complete
MYIRVVDITSPSKMQFEMTVAYFEAKWSPRVLELGALAAEFIQTGENSGIYIIHYPDEKVAKTVFQQIKSDVDSYNAQNKVSIKEGYRLFRIDS